MWENRHKPAKQFSGARVCACAYVCEVPNPPVEGMAQALLFWEDACATVCVGPYVGFCKLDALYPMKFFWSFYVL